MLSWESKVSLIFVSLTFVFIGMCESFFNGKCTYHSILSYFPARAIGCELTKQRWE